MKHLILAGILLTLPYPNIFAESSTSSAETNPISLVENHLLPAVTIKGQPLPYKNLKSEMERYNVPSVSIAVIDKGALAWTAAFGIKDVRTKEKVNEDTLYQGASFSKFLTAVTALELVEQGKLHLDTDVNFSLKTWKIPKNKFTQNTPVTLRELLSHTGGINIAGFNGYCNGEPIPSLKDLLTGHSPAKIPGVKVEREPGKEWSYSGGGYLILQQLIEDATGSSFSDYMKKTLFEPLGMIHSNFEEPLSKKNSTNAASGHDGKGIPIENKWCVFPELAAAGVWTTPKDIALLLIRLQKIQNNPSTPLLSENMLKEMLTPQKNHWGLGPELSGSNRQIEYSHKGAHKGYRNIFLAFPYLGQGAVVMTNGENGDILYQEIIRSIADVYKWPQRHYRETTILDLPVQELKNFLGTYSSTNGDFKISITLDNNQLIIHYQNSLSFKIYPETKEKLIVLENGDEFIFKDTPQGIRVEFPNQNQILLRN